VENREVAKNLYEIADFLEIKGVPFKPRAYRRAAKTIETLLEDIGTIYRRGELKKIPSVGASIASKIEELLETGSLGYLEELREELPEGLRDLMEIEGIGPKTALKLYEKLKISSIDELESAARQGKISRLEGFGAKTEENILRGIELYRSAQERVLLGYILPVAQGIEDRLKSFEGAARISLAGSIRRRRETIGDIDIVAVSEEPLKVMDFFTEMPEVKKVLMKGATRSSVLLSSNLQVDIRVVEKESFGAALQYLTGSKEHNIRLRDLAVDKHWKLSEYGLFDRETDERIAGETEEDIYQALGLSYIEPELRENRGEIDAALEQRLPDLVKYTDMKGDLHVHSNWSEGAHSIGEMAEAAKSLRYEYIAVCDHTKTLQIAHGMNENNIRERNKEIERLNREKEGITMLSGVEVNIDSNGKLDISNEVLKDLDVVVASVHSGFKQPKEKMTKRILTAMHNDYVDIIGHPTGRIINKRAEYQIDLPKIFEAATELGVILEINAFPDRLDLSDTNLFESRSYGVRFSINSDAHNKDHMRYVELGVATARRGWLEKKDIINTLTLEELKKQLS